MGQIPVPAMLDRLQARDLAIRAFRGSNDLELRRKGCHTVYLLSVSDVRDLVRRLQAALNWQEDATPTKQDF